MFNQHDLWPCHPKLQTNELLSCWLVRTAHAHNIKVQTFCERVFSNNKQIWVRDIDRLGSDWILKKMADHSANSLVEIQQSTLRSYEGFLYPHFREGGILQWILPISIWHRKRNGFGLQFCPICLKNDETPYFRKQWRVALYTFCPSHQTLMLDRCPNCGNGIVFHRVDQGSGRNYIDEDVKITNCHVCNYDLMQSPTQQICIVDHETHQLLTKLNTAIEYSDSSYWDLGKLTVMHHFCKLITQKHPSNNLYDYLASTTSTDQIILDAGINSFEERSVVERHHLLQLAAWLMIRPEERLKRAWIKKAIRYNLLKKDIRMMPAWYMRIVESCSNWRRVYN